MASRASMATGTQTHRASRRVHACIRLCMHLYACACTRRRIHASTCMLMYI